MMRLFVLFAVVVCCNACRFERISEDTTNNPQGCPDSDGNLHEFYSEWEKGPEMCVCVNFGIICCERMWNRFQNDFQPEPTEIIGDTYEELYGHENPNRFDDGGPPEPTEIIGDTYEQLFGHENPNRSDNTDGSGDEAQGH